MIIGRQKQGPQLEFMSPRANLYYAPPFPQRHKLFKIGHLDTKLQNEKQIFMSSVFLYKIAPSYGIIIDFGIRCSQKTKKKKS